MGENAVAEPGEIYVIRSYLAAGMTHPEILADAPHLTEEDIQACLSYAADRERQLLITQFYFTTKDTKRTKTHQPHGGACRAWVEADEPLDALGSGFCGADSSMHDPQGRPNLGEESGRVGWHGIEIREYV